MVIGFAELKVHGHYMGIIREKEKVLCFYIYPKLFIKKFMN